MQDYELADYLGDAYEETTETQREAMLAAESAIADRFAGQDDQEGAQIAFTAAVQVILGDATLGEVGAAWRRVRAAEVEARAAMTGALIASEGSERDLAERAGTTRMTVRKARGK